MFVIKKLSVACFQPLTFTLLFMICIHIC